MQANWRSSLLIRPSYPGDGKESFKSFQSNYFRREPLMVAISASGCSDKMGHRAFQLAFVEEHHPMKILATYFTGLFARLHILNSSPRKNINYTSPFWSKSLFLKANIYSCGNDFVHEKQFLSFSENIITSKAHNMFKSSNVQQIQHSSSLWWSRGQKGQGLINFNWYVLSPERCGSALILCIGKINFPFVSFWWSCVPPLPSLLYNETVGSSHFKY